VKKIFIIRIVILLPIIGLSGYIKTNTNSDITGDACRIKIINYRVSMRWIELYEDHIMQVFFPITRKI
jgi:hypothetical protein